MKALKIENLHKTYKNGVAALKGINFEVEQGDFFALLGPNGAGKSTTIGIITSLVTKSDGKVFVYDHDLDIDPQGVKSRIGLVPQEFNFNIFETVQQTLIKQAGYYGINTELATERSEVYLKKLDLWEKRAQQARNLSGGQKRRLMIARALVHQPPLLILDEPTAGVDIEIRRSMWNFLQNINKQGTTIILTTHYLEEAESLCKNIAIIDQGKIAEHTAMNVLLQKLHMETLILYLDKPIRVSPTFHQFACQLVDDTTLEVKIKKEQSINELFNELNRQNINILSMRNKTNRLEELFLNLTSRSNNNHKEHVHAL